MAGTMRADAMRNRAKILAAARDRITSLGPGVGMDEIAAAAGVAVGTLYRHFPTKTDLIEAVIAEHIGRVAEDAEASWKRVGDGASAFAEVGSFLARVVEASATDHAVKAAARALGADHPAEPAEQRAREALARMIGKGQSVGEIHPDVTVSDVYLLMSSAPTDQPAPARRRWLSLVLSGLANRDRIPEQ